MVNLNLRKEINKALYALFFMVFYMKKDKIIKFLKDIFPYVLIIILVVLIRTFIVTPAQVDGSSMKPTLNDNNLVILNKLDYRLNDIKRFDVVVVDIKTEKIIKRVIGLPGDTVSYKNKTLYINDKKVEENFTHTNDTRDFKLGDIGYQKIPGDKYFVVGDNRNNSMDSRMIGLVDKEQILGSVSFRFFPFNKIGKVK